MVYSNKELCNLFISEFEKDIIAHCKINATSIDKLKSINFDKCHLSFDNEFFVTLVDSTNNSNFIFGGNVWFSPLWDTEKQIKKLSFDLNMDQDIIEQRMISCWILPR